MCGPVFFIIRLGIQAFPMWQVNKAKTLQKLVQALSFENSNSIQFCGHIHLDNIFIAHPPYPLFAPNKQPSKYQYYDRNFQTIFRHSSTNVNSMLDFFHLPDFEWLFPR